MSQIIFTDGAFNPLSADPTKWSNTLKQFISKLPTNCLSVFDQFVGLMLKGLRSDIYFHLKLSCNVLLSIIKNPVRQNI